MKELMIKKKREDANREMLTSDLLLQMAFPEKIGLVKALKNEIISFPAYRYRKIKDLLTLCGDPTDPDVVLKSITALSDVFCDILPSYKIREYSKGEEDKEAKSGKGAKISKDVEALRNQEQFTLNAYKEFLQVLETFCKLNVGKLVRKAQGDDGEKERAMQTYEKLREKSIESFCALLERHPHFNFRVNIL